MKKYTLNTNYLVADIIAQFNLGLLRKIRFVKIVRTPLAIRIFSIFYNQGIIRTMRINKDHILIYYKYYLGQPICKVSIVSSPGKRQYWTLNKLSLIYNNSNFSGFYIISTQKGLTTSDVCLLGSRLSGEVLIKVEI